MWFYLNAAKKFSLFSTVVTNDFLSLLHLFQVKANAVLGSDVPPLTVKLLNAVASSSNEAFIQNKVLLHDPKHKKTYATGGGAQVSTLITGFIKVDSAEVAALDSDLGGIELKKNFTNYQEDMTSNILLGDAAMENSLICALGYVELDLPEAPDLHNL